jgi:cytochrome c5
MTREPLKTCPFCERDARMQQTADGAFWYYAECTHCYSRQLASQTEKGASRGWNMRGKDWTWRPADGS